MKIIFRELKLYNFMSFKEATIDLDKTGYFLIKGINNNINDLAESNGSGKSTLFESLCWALTGETVRGTKNVSNIFCDKGACVELTFSIDDDNYKIIRKKDPSNLLFFVNDEDKSGKGIRDTEKIIEQYLPDLSSFLIGSVVLLGQGMPQRFTNNSPSGRKELLEKLSKSDFMVCDLKEKVSKRKTELSEQIRKIEDDTLLAKNNEEILVSEINILKYRLTNFDTIDTLKKELTELSSKKNVGDKELSKYKEELDTLQSQQTKLLFDLEIATDDLESIINDFAKSDYTKNTQLLFKSLSSVESEIISIKSEISKIDSIVDICPTCGQKLVGVEKPDSTSLKEKLEILLKYKEQVNKKITEFKIKADEQLENDTKELKEKRYEVKENLEKVRKSIENCKYNIESLERKLSEINTDINLIQKEIDDYEIILENTEKDLEKKKQSLVEITNKILYNNNEHDLLLNKLSIINKIFSALNKEFRGYLLTNIIQYINKVAKEYCKQVFGNDKLNFELDGNNISISYFGKEYENLSGGEKQKVDIIIQFAIRKMLSKYLNFSCNLLVLDEVTDFLDKQGVESILNLISENLKDTPAIYFITHHEDLSFPYDGEIVVIKDSGGISTLLQK